MNALVSVRNNSAGILSPTPADRTQVNEKLAATAAAREGQSVVQAAYDGSPVTAADSASSASAGQSESIVPKDALGKDTFLQLLVMQMQNQDPVEPVDNSQMLAQLAQFSALEAQTNLNKNFELMSSNMDQLNFISASQMLTRYVEGVDINGEIHKGTVDSVHLDGSLVVLNVDGKMMSMAGILRIEDSDPNAPVASTFNN